MQFLQANATLIFFGIALLLMFYMHSGRGHSMGGGGRGHQHGESQQPEGRHEHGESQQPESRYEHGGDRSPDAKPVEPPVETWGSAEKETPTPVGAGSSHRGHGGGCH